MEEFSIKPIIKFGEDSLECLREEKFSKYFIVTDRSMVELKLIDHIIGKLNHNCRIEIFSEVEPNPSVETIEKGLKRMYRFDPDCVIALGGGSPIDACKGMLYFGYKLQKELNREKKMKFIAIPTTSGTGSEVTSYSVITKGSKKIALANNQMLPDVALLNPEFMKTLPKKIIADTGMDVLTHAIEAYVSKKRNPFTNSMAIEAIKLIYKNLLEHYGDALKLKPREKVQYASCMAGIAFNNSSLGINHSVAHTLGAKLHIPHGRANAIVMPYIIEANSGAQNLYAKIARELGLPASNCEEGKNSLRILTELFKEQMDIPVSLQEMGISFEEYKKLIPEFLMDIKNDICTEYNPNKFSDEEYIQLLLRIYFGNNGNK